MACPWCDGVYRMSPAVLQAGLDGLDASLRNAMEAAVVNIRSFHEHQRDKSWFVEDGDGVLLGKKVTPIDRLGICVPAGEVPLFSSLLMCALPAQIAGVGEICVVSPPQQDGQVHPVIAAAARLIGIDEVHAVGGAQAVGAMAYGTETVAPVDKIVGPGSPYTVAAQKQVFGLRLEFPCCRVHLKLSSWLTSVQIRPILQPTYCLKPSMVGAWHRFASQTSRAAG